jgi:hypothetical protein
MSLTVADYQPILARTRTVHRPVGPVVYDCVKVIVVRSGSAILFSEFGQKPDHQASVVGDGCDQVRRTASPGGGSADGFAVDRDHWLAIDLPPTQPGPSATQPAEHAGVEGFDDPADRRFARHRAGQLYLVEQVSADVVGPLTNPGQRAGAGGHGSHRDHQHDRQAVASAASVAGVGNVGHQLHDGGGTQHSWLDAVTRDRGRCHWTRSFVEVVWLTPTS